MKMKVLKFAILFLLSFKIFETGALQKIYTDTMSRQEAYDFFEYDGESWYQCYEYCKYDELCTHVNFYPIFNMSSPILSICYLKTGKPKKRIAEGVYLIIK